MSDKTPSPTELRKMREGLGLSQADLATALGFGSNGDRTIRAWEKGERDGVPFHPTKATLTTFKYLICLYELYKELPMGSQLEVKIGLTLPEVLR